ncbi:MAG: DUF2061 domain-containing protein [bacterium]|nr:DUF2061 domain-containing protein [bacterium]
MFEKSYRSVVKAFSWRITGTLDTVLVAFFITGKISAALSIGAVEVFTKMVLYYLHERAWNKVKLGRVIPADDYQI